MYKVSFSELTFLLTSHSNCCLRFSEVRSCMYLVHLKVQFIEGGQSGEGEHLKDRFPLPLSILPSPGINVTRLLASFIAANGNTALKNICRDMRRRGVGTTQTPLRGNQRRPVWL